MRIVIVPGNNMSEATEHIKPACRIDIEDFVGVYDMRTRTLFTPDQGPDTIEVFRWVPSSIRLQQVPVGK